MWAPRNPPRSCPAASGSAMDHTIAPRLAKRMAAATFEAKFATLASALARASESQDPYEARDVEGPRPRTEESVVRPHRQGGDPRDPCPSRRRAPGFRPRPRHRDENRGQDEEAQDQGTQDFRADHAHERRPRQGPQERQRERDARRPP